MDRPEINVPVQLKIPGDEYEPEQGYLYGVDRHRQHVGIGGYRRRLDFYTISQLEERYAAWFKHFHYRVGEEAAHIEGLLYE